MRELDAASNKQLNTAKNFYKSSIFSKTSVEDTAKDYMAESGSKNEQRMGQSYVNFIERNKRLGRVADINKRRFSGAFDHLNIFPAESEEKDKIAKQTSTKREAATARVGNRVEFNNFESKKRSKTPAVIDSYRNHR